MNRQGKTTMFWWALLAAALLFFLVFAIASVKAEDVIVKKEVRIEIDFEQDNAENDRWIRLTAEDADDRDEGEIEFEWELDDPPSDQVWSFDYEFLLEEDEQCNRFKGYFDTMQTHYTEMINICNSVSEGWGTSGDLLNKALNSERELASCNEQLKTKQEQVVEKTGLVSTYESDAETCEADLDQTRTELERARSTSTQCQNDRTTALSKADEEENNKKIWGGAGIALGAMLMYFYLKKGGGGMSVERPSDEGGF